MKSKVQLYTNCPYCDKGVCSNPVWTEKTIVVHTCPSCEKEYMVKTIIQVILLDFITKKDGTKK